MDGDDEFDEMVKFPSPVIAVSPEAMAEIHRLITEPAEPAPALVEAFRRRFSETAEKSDV